MSYQEYAQIYGVEHRVIKIKHANILNLEKTLKQFFDKETAAKTKIVADADSNQMILLIAKPMIETIEKLIEKLDVPFEEDILDVINLKFLRASEVVPLLEKFLNKSDVKDAGRHAAAAGKLGDGGGMTAKINWYKSRWKLENSVHDRANIKCDTTSRTRH